MRKLRYIFYVFILLISQGYSVHAQTDTEFWFAAPEVAQLNMSHDQPIMLYFTTYNQEAEITVLQPARNDTFHVVKVPANDTKGINLTWAMGRIETQPANTVLKNGLLIKSTAPITVYYEVVSLCNCNPEFFVLKGKNALGKDFWIPSQNNIDNATVTQTPAPKSSFDIIATEDNTNVLITPTNDIVGHIANTTFFINLNKGEVYSATAKSSAGPGHLGGSHVTSNKPIAITVKDDELWFGPNTCADLVGDQIVPIDHIGKEYIAVNGFLTQKDRLYIIGVSDGTSVSQDGSFVKTIAAGETLTLQINGSSTYISADKPVYAWQLTGIGCELGATILPAVGCTGSYSVSFTRSTEAALIVNLLVRKEGRGSFLINGQAGLIDTAVFKVVPGTNGRFYSANIDLPEQAYPKGTKISITNLGMVFNAGVLHGTDGTGTSFGYFTNYGGIVPLVWTSEPACDNESLQLFTHEITDAKYTWTGSNGFHSTKAHAAVFPIKANSTETYHLTMQAGGCTGTTSIKVTIGDLKISPDIRIDPDYDSVAVCPNSHTTLTASGGISYNWMPARGLTQVTGPIATPFVDEPAMYVVVGKAENGCSGYDTAWAVLRDTILSTDSWAICSDARIQYGRIIVSDTGYYLQYFKTAGGCDSAVMLHVSHKDPPTADFSISPAVPQLNEPIQFFDKSTDAISYSWDFGDNTLSTEQNPKYLFKKSGLYNVCLTVKNKETCPHVFCQKIPAEVYPNVNVPDAFSPNGDGANDILYLCGGAVTEVHFKIYNRWGQVVFETSDMKQGWDGKHNGKEQEMDVYAYSLSAVYVDGSVYQTRGNITLIR